MNLLTNRRFQIGLISALSLAVVAYSVWIYLYTYDRERMISNSTLPAEGIAQNDTKGLVPGDPKNGERALKNAFKYYLIYKKLHGHLPKFFTDVSTDITKNTKAYGNESLMDIFASMANVDNQYSDNELTRRNPKMMTDMSDVTRPDGSALFTQKPEGVHDVLMVSDTYVHQNTHQFPNYRTTTNPVGFYQVLWDDGRVENIPYDKVMYVRISKPGNPEQKFQYAYPGQAGIPSSALTYDQYYKQVAHWVPPHGAPGAPGLDYSGKPIKP